MTKRREKLYEVDTGMSVTSHGSFAGAQRFAKRELTRSGGKYFSRVTIVRLRETPTGTVTADGPTHTCRLVKGKAVCSTSKRRKK